LAEESKGGVNGKLCSGSRDRLNRQFELTAHQQSKAAWIARADFNSEPLEGHGRTRPELQQAGVNRRGTVRQRRGKSLAGHKRHDLAGLAS
jgi:hypothetical protein